MKFDLIYRLKYPSWGPQGGSKFLSKSISEVHWLNDHMYQVWAKSNKNWRRSSLLKEFELKTLILNFDTVPKRVTRILFDLQNEHNSGKAYYGDAKYLIDISLT